MFSYFEIPNNLIGKTLSKEDYMDHIEHLSKNKYRFPTESSPSDQFLLKRKGIVYKISDWSSNIIAKLTHLTNTIYPLPINHDYINT